MGLRVEDLEFRMSRVQDLGFLGFGDLVFD